MNAWTGLALIALGGTLTYLWAWGHGYACGRRESARLNHHAEAHVLGWMKVAAAAEARADEAEALLALDFNVRNAL